MRNINTKLRQTRNTALLIAAAGGLVYMTACSSDVNYDGGQNVPETTAKNASYTVYGADQSRIHNFGTEGTRAAADFTMPECPTIPDDAQNLKDINNGNVPEGIYALNANETFNSGLILNNSVIYVAGTLNIGQYLKGKGTIYVLENGTLHFTEEWGLAETGVNIYNYGTITGTKNISFTGKLYSATDIDAPGQFSVNPNSESYCKGTITANVIDIQGKAEACAFIASEKILMNSISEIKTSYIKTSRLEMNASGIVLDNNALVDVRTSEGKGTIFLSNQDTRITVDGTNAVIAADKFITNNEGWIGYQFASQIACDFSFVAIGNEWYSNECSINDLGLLTSDRNQVVYVPAGDCHPSYGKLPEQKPEDPDDETIEVPEIVKVAEIDPLDPDHDHGIISATCIQFGDDGRAYASYHLRGTGSKGCIEVIDDMGAAGLKLGSYMISPEYDYNHILVDGNDILVVGNNSYDRDNDGTFKGGIGAFVGRLKTDFAASEGVREDFYVKELTTDEVLYGANASGDNIRLGYKNAGDGNCIVKYGDNYLVTTYRGYGAINKEDLSKVSGTFHATNGSSKHITLSGDKAYVLSHDTYDKTSSTASVEVLNLSNGTFADVLKKYDAIGTITPVDGKNVIAVDGEDIYTCLSHGGIARIRNGQVETKTFGSNEASAHYKGVPVNGMALDANYIYLAAGSFVYVLDKESMTEICHYHAQSQKSANYIALNNGKIYVAYGEDGIMAFELRKKEISL